MKVEARTVSRGSTPVKQIEIVFGNQDSVTMGMDRARQLARDLFRLTEQAEPQPGTVDALRAFVCDALNLRHNGLDGFDVEQLGVKHGLLIRSVVHKPCGDGCRCEMWTDDREMAKGVTCFKLADVLLAPAGESWEVA